MRNRSCALIPAAALMVSGCASTPPVKQKLAALQRQLEGRLNRRRFARAEWGMKVVSLANGKTVFEHNAQKMLKPASNAKMYTAALALDRLGPDYQIKTSFYAQAKPDTDGTIHGDLLVYGRGDPCFSSRFNGGDCNRSLDSVLAAFSVAGIKRIEGDLIGDESYFRGPPFGTDWTWDDLQEDYGAPVSALSVLDNNIGLVFKAGAAVGDPCQIITLPDTNVVTFVNWTRTTAPETPGEIKFYRPVGQDKAYVWGGIALDSKNQQDTVSVSKPALWFVSLLKQALAQHGIEVTGGVRSVDWLDRRVNPIDLSKQVEVAFVMSRPLASIIRNTLKPSENLYAQLLLLQVGATSETVPDSDMSFTETEGIGEMHKFLTKLGIPRRQAILEEGTGLSRGCLVSADATVRLLTYMWKHDHGDVFFDALPIAGVDGTMGSRLVGTAAEGNVRAKTGTLAHVSALSGYLVTRGHQEMAFSIMVNNYTGWDGRDQIDALVEKLVEFEGKVR